jgi:hypothetical protein
MVEAKAGTEEGWAGDEEMNEQQIIALLICSGCLMFIFGYLIGVYKGENEKLRQMLLKPKPSSRKGVKA